MANIDCPICNAPADSTQIISDLHRFDCRVCGRFQITGTEIALLNASKPDRRIRAGLSAYVRQANRRGETPSDLIFNKDWRALAEAQLASTVGTKSRKLLEYYAEKSGGRLATNLTDISTHHDYPLFDVVEPDDVGFLINALVERGDLHRHTGVLRMTARGWEKLEPTGGGGVPGTCFVAMSFGDELTTAYTLGIEPAILDCGFSVVRLDRVEHADNINDRIIADIRRAQFVVAEFAKHPGGVYFEAGFAYGLGKLVIWTCRKDDFHQKVHFDTRPFNHILWDTEVELREKLTNRIRALVPNARMA